MPPFTPRQRWFRRIEQLWIGASLTEDGYTITRVENALYSVTHGDYSIEIRDVRAGSVLASIERVVTYCLGSKRSQSCIRSQARKRTQNDLNQSKGEYHGIA